MKEVIPVGVGMRDCQCLIINSAGLLAGVGELAEIYMRSPHIAKGYIGLESASTEKFLPNPFHPARLTASKTAMAVDSVLFRRCACERLQDLTCHRSWVTESGGADGRRSGSYVPHR